MSEKQSKRLRGLEARETALEKAVEEQGVRLTVCEAAINWTRAYELELKDAALAHTRSDLKRARKRARILEETLCVWKTAAITALVVLLAAAVGTVIL